MRRSYDGSLADRIKANMFSAESAVDVALAVLLALQTLSSKSVIHRDIHPGNIMFFGMTAI
jgi:serine/threonine protein kinase